MAERIVIQKKLEEAIAVMKPGSAFTAADFSYLNDPDSVNKALSRIAESGKIRRAMQGVYDIPMKITLLEEDCDPLIPQVAYAIARKNGWSIAPYGYTALYELGIGKRPKTVWTYVSDGMAKDYVIGTQKIKIKTVKSREISGKHPKSALVIQVIRTFGKEITPEQIDAISEHLTREEKMILLEESMNVSAWIRKVVSQIAHFRIQKLNYDDPE
ncbi:MAG TPA: hypothetical protein DHW39_06045 [Erysipelotrichaceae bacterium]|nr:hypothetical protein [Erysipelotrichaceae bacterium]